METCRELENVTALLQELHQLGLDAERGKDHHLAIERFSQALDLAEEEGNLLACHHLRWHIGIAQLAAGHYRQAAAVLTPALWRDPPYGPDQADLVCPGITGRELRPALLFTYIQASLELPVASRAIESCLKLLGETVAAGYPDNETATLYRMAYLLCQADFLLSRGKLKELLNMAKEARSELDNNYHSTHGGMAAFACAVTGDRDQALRHLEDVRQSDLGPGFWSRQAEITLARHEGDAELAVKLAGEARFAANAERFLNRRHRAEVTLVEASLAAGSFGAAGSGLLRLRHNSSRESYPQQFDILRLLGEYHLALARVAAGLPPEDCRYGREPAKLPRLKNPAQAAKQSGRALRWLTLAAAKGALLDAASGTSHGAELRPRLEAAARLREKGLGKTRAVVGKTAHRIGAVPRPRG